MKELLKKMIDRETRYLEDAKDRQDKEDQAIYLRAIRVLKEVLDHCE